MRLHARAKANIANAAELTVGVWQQAAAAWGRPSRGVTLIEDRVTWQTDIEIMGPTDIEIEPRPDGTVRASARATLSVPYFGWAVRPFLTHILRHRLRHVLAVAKATSTESEPPPAPKPLAWFPHAAWHPEQITTVTTICMALAISTYCWSLIGQTSNAFTASYGISDTTLTFILSVTRVGTLVALVGSWLADREGRRRVLIWGLVALCVTTAASGIAPGATTFAVLQVLVRGFANLVGPVAMIMIIEEVPDQARASTLALAALAGGAGYALSSLLLPLLDIGGEMWRVLYGLGIVWLAFVFGIRRRLPETRRYVELATRDAPRGRLSEVVDRRYGSRFAIFAIAAFLLNFAAAPSSQLMVRFLQNERGFSGFQVLLIRGVTQGLPVVVAVLAGGWLAERRGRIGVASVGIVIATVGDALFFLSAVPLLWIWLTVSTSASGLAGPAMGALGGELFPTEVRGTANAGTIATSVLGGILGLLFVGWARQYLGSIGAATAATDIAPFIVGVFLIRRLPESRGRTLEEISPSEV